MPTKTLTPAAKAFKKVKLKSISKLKHEADKWCSIYIRQSAANSEGIAECYTCGAIKTWKELQCGHYISRSYNATRFDLENLRVQCSGCNIWGRGKLNVFAEKLFDELGHRGFKALLRRGNQTRQFARKELEKIIEDFKQKIKTLNDNG